MKVVLVTHDALFGRYLAARLSAAGAVDRIIVERRAAPPGFYWRKLKRVGPINAAFQVWLNRAMRRSAAHYLPDLPMPAHESVTSVNECTFGDDELVIAFGTSIVTAATLARTPRGILNLHTGWLPDYRGVKSEFWVLAHDDREKFGWALHFMTPRLDEGDVVLRGRVNVPVEDAGHLRALLLIDAAAAIAEFVFAQRRGASIEREPQHGGRYFTTPTLRDWLAYRRARR